MSYKNTLEDLDKQIEEALEREEKETENVEETEEAPVVEETDEEAENPDEKTAEAPEEVKTEKQDNANGARLRREAAAAQRKAEQLEEENRRLKEDQKLEPEAPEVPDVLAPIIHEHNKARAWEELTMHEQAVRSTNPDYDAIAGAYTSAVAQSIRTLNPDLSPNQIVQMTKDKILEQAASYARKGFDNPAEEMYLRAKEMGFKAPSKEEEVKERRPDMAKVAANRARNAGTAAASGGTSEGMITPSAYMEMTVAERMAIPKAERDRLTKR